MISTPTVCETCVVNVTWFGIETSVRGTLILTSVDAFVIVIVGTSSSTCAGLTTSVWGKVRGYSPMKMTMRCSGFCVFVTFWPFWSSLSCEASL